MLVDRAELKPLAAFAAKRLTGVAFVSGDLRSAVGTTKKDFEQFTTSAAELLKQLDVAKPLEDRILADVKGFVTDIQHTCRTWARPRPFRSSRTAAWKAIPTTGAKTCLSTLRNR